MSAAQGLSSIDHLGQTKTDDRHLNSRVDILGYAKGSHLGPLVSLIF
jgi:hypothetical protein